MTTVYQIMLRRDVPLDVAPRIAEPVLLTTPEGVVMVVGDGVTPAGALPIIAGPGAYAAALAAAGEAQAARDGMVVGAEVVGDDLVVSHVDGSTSVAGNVRGLPGTDGTDGIDGDDGESVTVTLVPDAQWPPAADPNPLHLYVRVP